VSASSARPLVAARIAGVRRKRSGSAGELSVDPPGLSVQSHRFAEGAGLGQHLLRPITVARAVAVEQRAREPVAHPPRARPSSRISAASRVLPTPGSQPSSTRALRPAAALASMSSSFARSASRPTTTRLGPGAALSVEEATAYDGRAFALPGVAANASCFRLSSSCAYGLGPHTETAGPEGTQAAASRRRTRGGRTVGHRNQGRDRGSPRRVHRQARR